MSTDPLKDIIDRMHAPETLDDASEPEDLGWVMLDGQRLPAPYVRDLGWRLIGMADVAKAAPRVTRCPECRWMDRPPGDRHPSHDWNCSRVPQKRP